MSETQQPKGSITLNDLGKSSRIVNRIFKFIFGVIYVFTLVTAVYWFSQQIVMCLNLLLWFRILTLLALVSRQIF